MSGQSRASHRSSSIATSFSPAAIISRTSSRSSAASRTSAGCVSVQPARCAALDRDAVAGRAAGFSSGAFFGHSLVARDAAEDTVDAMGMIPIQCTECGGLSQIDEAWVGGQVECPHCHRPTLAAAKPATTASPPPPPPPPPPTVPPTPAVSEPTPAIVSKAPEPATSEPAAPAEPEPKRPPLTRAQREAIRRRRHLILALGGAVILLGTAYALFLLAGRRAAAIAL